MGSAGVWIFTRPGFEAEGGREWLDRAASLGIHGFFKPHRGLGLAYFEAPDQPRVRHRQRDDMPVSTLVFVRDAVFELRRVHPLPKEDRVGALLDALQDLPKQQWGEVLVHVPEGSGGRDLSSFARKWTTPVAGALRRHHRLAPARDGDTDRLDLILLDFDTLVVGQSFPGHRAAHPGGRIRLRLPADAPSRSTLKLEEAFLTLLTEPERNRLLTPGMTAADLGASPGGWTHYLARRHLSVTAVDNGPMDEALSRNELVAHVRADGFAWLPDKPVDWMVCDIVDKPGKVIELIGRWFRDGHCRACVFNLKLPMKRRLEEWYLCRKRLEDLLHGAVPRLDIRAKQLYHDREELTVVVLPRSR